MKLLILGGTIFLGRALVDVALSRGHQVTLFNRGKTNPTLYPEVEQIHGDRDKDLSALKGRTWDVVIDTCGYIPRHVRLSAAALAGSAGLYTFISTLSVFSDWSKFYTAEDGELGKLEDETVEEINGETYGPLKVLCEKALSEKMPGKDLIIRPGLIVGPYDPTDRFTYYPLRIAKGGEVLVPGRPERVIEFIDVRDLAAFTLLASEKGLSGPYNTTGPIRPIPMGDYVEMSRVVSGSNATFTWVGEEFLLEQKVAPFVEIPMWLPEIDPSAAGGMTFNINKALAVGLSFRPMADTLRDTIQWANTRPADHAWRAGLTAEREAELLKLWKAK